MDKLPLQIVDEEDQPIATVSWQDAYKQGLRHRVVLILVVNEDDKFLIKKCSEQSTLFPGRWGVSAASALEADERYDVGAARIMAEELGLTNVPIEDIATYPTEITVDNYDLKRINKVFRAQVQHDVELRPDPEEVAEVRWMSAAEIKQLVTEQPDAVTDGLHDIAERVL